MTLELAMLLQRIVTKPVVGRLLRLDALVDFLAMNRDFRGCGYTHAHLIAADAEYRYRRIIANSDGFTDTASENEHRDITLA
jgi:hypothetical protein